MCLTSILEKKVEVIAFAVDEPIGDILYATEKKKAFTAVKLKTKGKKFNREWSSY